MIIEKIKQKFNEVKYPIIFLFDTDKEYEEELTAYDSTDFKVIKVDRNFFAVKYAIEYREVYEKLLLYHPSAEPKEKEYTQYPLTDLLLAGSSNVLAMDEIGELLSTYGIPFQQRKDIERVRKWVKPKKNLPKLLPVLTNKPFDIQKLYSTVISIILEERKVGSLSFNLIRVFELLQDGIATWEKKQRVLIEAGLDESLKQNLFRLLRIHVEDIRYDTLKRLFQQLKYNMLTYLIADVEKADEYEQLKIKDDIAKIKINNFFKDWQDDKHKSKNFEAIFDDLGSAINEEKIYAIYGPAQEYGIKTKKIVDGILRNALKQVTTDPSAVVQEYASVKNRIDEYEGYEDKVLFIFYAARFFELLRRYADFIFDKTEDYILRYEKELYKLDSFYRRAFTAYQQFSNEMIPEYESVFAALNKSYDQYLIDLNNPWVKSLYEIGFAYGQLSTAKQFNFYKDVVKPISNKKVIIISDALRYELGQALVEDLKSDSDNELSCSAMLASIPSYTNLGMTNLLPNHGIEALLAEDGINFSIDGVKTVSTNRENILKQAEKNAAVIDYATFSKFNTEAGRSYLKDKQTVYVYHNWMDTIGDKQSSEYYTFESAEQCITQLKTLIRKLYGSFNIYNVVVTADHGFLFNYKKISDASSQQLPDLKNALKEHTRFCLTLDEIQKNDTFHFPLSATTNISSDVQVVIPKSINRFRKKGNIGKQFVHGGSSLQEVIVPVVQLYRNRWNQAKVVNFKRIDTLESVSTSVFKLNFLQVEPIGTNYKARTLLVAVYDIDERLISNEVEVVLNMTSDLPAERSIEVKLELNPKGSRSKTGFIKVFDKEDKLNTLLKDLLKINLLDEIDSFD